MSIVDTITVQDFKTQFPRFVPVYLPVYVADKTYFKDDIVYYSVTSLFYRCTHDGVTSIPTTQNDWELTNQTVLNYTQDSDILNAMAEAKVNFNEQLFNSDDVKLIFLYLTAYYLTVDFQNALGQANAGIVTSKSVGSVSESYGIPQWMLQERILGAYARNGYGLKYLSLIKPYLVGNLLFFSGATTI